MSITVLAKNTCQSIGEGPFWDEATQSLLYVDIMEGDVHRWNTATNEDEKIHFNDSVSFIIPRKSGGCVIGLGKTVSSFDWSTGATVQALCDVDQGLGTRFNDAKCDASGRLWAGTMGTESTPAVVEPKAGSLFSVDVEHVVKKHLDKIDISNGLAWTLDNKIMYYIDSLERKVFAFDFDITTGTMSNQRTAVDFGEGTRDVLGLPDGMCIDNEQKLWVACFGVGKVIRFDPETGKELQTLTFPCEKTTSCCFGGPDYTELFVTTGRWRLSDEKLAQQPLAGSVFKVTGLGVHGFPAPAYNG